jgi:NADPH:quinone reductase
MKAAVIHEFGKNYDVLQYEDVPTPKVTPGQVLVKVAACGLNRFDLYLRMSGIRRDIPMPHVMGADITGWVAAVGDGVTGFSEDDRVIVAPGFPVDPADWDYKPINQASSYAVTGSIQWGGYAEYVLVPARFVLPDKTNLPQEELATVPLCVLTAVHAVKSLGEVREGMHVLIQAGASGSGSMCIQVAKSLGAKVMTTVGSESKAAWVKSIGADEVVRHDDVAQGTEDTRDDEVLRQFQKDQVARVKAWTNGRGVDVVIDNVGAAVFEANQQSMRVGGTFVNFGLVSGYRTEFNLKNFFFNHHTLKGSMMGTTEDLAEGISLVERGLVKPVLDRTFPLRDAAAAHEYVDSRAVHGSVVLIP